MWRFAWLDRLAHEVRYALRSLAQKTHLHRRRRRFARLAAVTFAAAMWPAVRASQLDPMAALRHD